MTEQIDCEPSKHIEAVLGVKRLPTDNTIIMALVVCSLSGSGHQAEYVPTSVLIENHEGAKKLVEFYEARVHYVQGDGDEEEKEEEGEEEKEEK